MYVHICAVASSGRGGAWPPSPVWKGWQCGAWLSGWARQHDRKNRRGAGGSLLYCGEGSSFRGSIWWSPRAQNRAINQPPPRFKFVSIISFCLRKCVIYKWGRQCWPAISRRKLTTRRNQPSQKIRKSLGIFSRLDTNKEKRFSKFELKIIDLFLFSLFLCSKTIFFYVFVCSNVLLCSSACYKYAKCF